MRRLARHLFTLCSLVSLLLCVALCALWVRSYWYVSYLQYKAPVYAGQAYQLTYSVSTSPGEFGLGVQYGSRPPEAREAAEWSYYDHPRKPPRGNDAVVGTLVLARPPTRLLGFEYYNPRDEETRSYSYHWLTVPAWAPTALAGVLPAAAGLQLIRRRTRQNHGVCPACGYDLRASLERCPECGKSSSPASLEVGNA